MRIELEQVKAPYGVYLSNRYLKLKWEREDKAIHHLEDPCDQFFKESKRLRRNFKKKATTVFMTLANLMDAKTNAVKDYNDDYFSSCFDVRRKIFGTYAGITKYTFSKIMRTFELNNIIIRIGAFSRFKLLINPKYAMKQEDVPTVLIQLFEETKYFNKRFKVRI